MSVTADELRRCAEAIRFAEPPEEHECWDDLNPCLIGAECPNWRRSLELAQAEAAANVLRPEWSELICSTCLTPWGKPHTVSYCRHFVGCTHFMRGEE